MVGQELQDFNVASSLSNHGIKFFHSFWKLDWLYNSLRLNFWDTLKNRREGESTGREHSSMPSCFVQLFCLFWPLLPSFTGLALPEAASEVPAESRLALTRLQKAFDFGGTSSVRSQSNLEAYWSLAWLLLPGCLLSPRFTFLSESVESESVRVSRD